MKKIGYTLALIVGCSFTIAAQDIATHAIGLRLGDASGFNTEVNYQRALGDNNRLELGLSWRDADTFNAVKGTGLYQWIWNIDGGFNWYAGAGASLGIFDADDDAEEFTEDDSDLFVNAAGNIGIEYKFDFPLLLSLDFRPEISIINDIDNSVEFDFALGVRYTF